MALIRFAEGQQRSGSIGATVYSHNRYGQYIRARSIPVNPQTERQVAARNRLRALASAWQNILTQTQRDAWDLYADNVPWVSGLSESIHLTGLNMYVRTNAIATAAGLARIDAAPTNFTLAVAEQTLSATASEATQQLTIAYDDTAPWDNETGACEAFYMGSPQNSGITFFNGPWRNCGFVLGVTGVPVVSPFVATSQYPIADGQRLFVYSRVMRADGRLSGRARTSFLCAP